MNRQTDGLTDKKTHKLIPVWRFALRKKQKHWQIGAMSGIWESVNYVTNEFHSDGFLLLHLYDLQNHVFLKLKNDKKWQISKYYQEKEINQCDHKCDKAKIKYSCL